MFLFYLGVWAIGIKLGLQPVTSGWVVAGIFGLHCAWGLFGMVMDARSSSTPVRTGGWSAADQYELNGRMADDDQHHQERATAAASSARDYEVWEAPALDALERGRRQ